MAIKNLTDNDEILSVEINNGDLEALNEIVGKWEFKDKESALRFAIAVLKITQPGTLLQATGNGNTHLAPTENLKQPR